LLVLETDSPYLPPVPYRGQRNESAYLTHIATRLADAKETTVERIAALTTENAKRLFSLEM
jgi:TatD DNase family protein